MLSAGTGQNDHGPRGSSMQKEARPCGPSPFWLDAPPLEHAGAAADRGNFPRSNQRLGPFPSSFDFQKLHRAKLLMDSRVSSTVWMEEQWRMMRFSRRRLRLESFRRSDAQFADCNGRKRSRCQRVGLTQLWRPCSASSLACHWTMHNRRDLGHPVRDWQLRLKAKKSSFFVLLGLLV